MTPLLDDAMLRRVYSDAAALLARSSFGAPEHSAGLRAVRDAAFSAALTPVIVEDAGTLDALPVGTILRDRYATVWEVMDPEDGGEGHRYRSTTADPYYRPESLARNAPLTVVWTPEPTE